MSLRTALFVALVVPSSLALGGVYKSIGPDGQVQFTGTYVKGSEKIKVDPPGPATPVTPEALDFGPYDEITILTPEPNETLRKSDGQVPVSIIIDPPLYEGQRLEVNIDGQVVPGKSLGTQFILQEVTFGSHRLQLFIVDDELNAPVAASEVTHFHLRKPLE